MRGRSQRGGRSTAERSTAHRPVRYLVRACDVPRGTHRHHDINREEEYLQLVPQRERDNVRDARERREQHTLDDDGSRTRVRAPDIGTHGPPEVLSDVNDAHGDERRD